MDSGLLQTQKNTIFGFHEWHSMIFENDNFKAILWSSVVTFKGYYYIVIKEKYPVLEWFSTGIQIRILALSKSEILLKRLHLVVISVNWILFYLIIYFNSYIVNSSDILKCWNMEKLWWILVEIFSFVWEKYLEKYGTYITH